ncbi:MAG: BamA/TamA family outer membrane protein [Bacteroidales bacterium]|nr:BamA/TamA family outer membrane protein [Bacteroidales bacterium]
MMKVLHGALIAAMIAAPVKAQPQAEPAEKTEKIKTGWNLGFLPVVAYDSDIGFKYGAAMKLYHYGDGSVYPKYRHYMGLEWSRTTKGSGINQFLYDSEYLIPGIRVTGEASLLTEKAIDFYGFNGYSAYYDPDYEDDEADNYISRMYYRQERRLTRIKTDFQGKISGPGFKWIAGIEYNRIKTGTVDIAKLNKDKDEGELLPDTALLFDRYVEWGFIDEDQADGGTTTLIKAGLVYDTRDIEANPMKGIWTDVQFMLAPSFLGNGKNDYIRIALTHRQYFTLVPEALSFAYRLSYQTKLTGNMPYYMLPFVYNTAPERTRDGLGGAKTVRGVLLNRVVGEGFLFGNLELRWKFLQTIVFNQNIYLALSGFLDGGMVTGKYELPETVNPEAVDYLNKGADEKLHMGAGAGFHFVMNQNFVVAVDYARALDPDDGVKGLYIGFDFLF